MIELKDIMSHVKRRKQDYEERMASIKEGREGREKYGSRKGKKDKAVSSTNREKSKKKNIMMMVHKRSVKAKSKMSLREKQVSNFTLCICRFNIFLDCPESTSCEAAKSQVAIRIKLYY